MKANLTRFFTLLVSFGVLLMIATSCEKDEAATTQSSTGNKAYANAVAGNYVGRLTMYLQEMPTFELPTLDQMEVVITAEQAGTIAITLPVVEYDLNGRLMTLPSVSQGGIVVEKNDQGYAIVETAINQTIGDKSYVGIIKGSYANGTLLLEFSAKYGTMPMTLIFNFNSAEGGIEPTPANVVAGRYDGRLLLGIEGMDMEFDPIESVTLTLTATSDSTISIAIPSITYSFNGMERSMDGFTVENVKVTKSNDNAYSLSETEINQTVGESQYVGSISGTWDARVLAMHYTVKPGAMPMNIVFDFEMYD